MTKTEKKFLTLPKEKQLYLIEDLIETYKKICYNDEINDEKSFLFSILVDPRDSEFLKGLVENTLNLISISQLDNNQKNDLSQKIIDLSTIKKR